MTHITYCERKVGKVRCNLFATIFAAGQWVCHQHRPEGDQSCSHSLTTDGRCSYCGDTVPGAADDDTVPQFVDREARSDRLDHLDEVNSDGRPHRSEYQDLR